MARTVETNARRSHDPRPSRILIAFLAAGAMVSGLAAQPQVRDKPAQRRQMTLERFHKLSPEERLNHVEKMAGADKPFTAVVRGDLNLTVVERGSVESAEMSDIHCQVKGRTTIKWLIDDGAAVKKGERLIELDDAALRKHLQAQKTAFEQAMTALIAADAAGKLLRSENELAVRAEELKLKIARLELKKDDGKDAERREILQLKVEQAQLAVETAKLRGQANELKAGGPARKALEVALEQESSRKRALEAQLAECVIKAPQAGIAVYHIPEPSPFSNRPAVLAAGESVREGQKLMRVCGLERFTVLARVDEADIPRVRVGQEAQTRIDAFPDVVLKGLVKEVSTVASQRDWLARAVKVYPVVVEINPALPGLKPGMSAEVRMEGALLPKVLQVPRGSVARIGREMFCYVRIGKELRERKVTLGASSAMNVEIKEGLKEGDEVLRAPGL